MNHRYVIEVDAREIDTLVGALGFSAGVHQKRKEESEARECLDLADSLICRIRAVKDVQPVPAVRLVGI